MITVKISHKDNRDNQGKVIKALQKLKQIVSREGILNEVKKRRYFNFLSGTSNGTIYHMDSGH